MIKITSKNNGFIISDDGVGGQFLNGGDMFFGKNYISARPNFNENTIVFLVGNAIIMKSCSVANIQVNNLTYTSVTDLLTALDTIFFLASNGGGAGGGTDKGIWNPKTNTPDIFTLLTASGEFAVIDGLDAGETYNFDFGGTKGGVVAFTIGDKVYFNGVIFQKQETYVPTADEIIYDKTNPLLGSVKEVVDFLSERNTGDETKSSIEEKLGVSIVNVIDEGGDLSAQVPTVQAFDDAITPVITNLEQQIDLKLSQDYLTNQFKGGIDISTNPNYPAGKKGDVYLATSTAPLPYNLTGKIGGANGKDLQINNVIFCVKDTSGGNEATAGKDWKVLHDYPAFEYDDGSVGGTGLLTGFFFQKLYYVTSLNIIYDDKDLTSNTIIGGTGTITYPNSYLFKIRYSRITIYNKFTNDATIIMPNMTESVATSFSRDEDIFLLTNQTTSEKPVNIVTQNFQLDLNTGLYTQNPVPFRRQDGSIVSFLSIDPNVSSTIRWSHTQQRFEEQ